MYFNLGRDVKQMYTKIKEKRAIRVVDLPADLTKSLLPADVESAAIAMLSGRSQASPRCAPPVV